MASRGTQRGAQHGAQHGAHRDTQHGAQHSAAPRFLRSAFLGYCPNCLLGSLFSGLLKPRRTCSVCGMKFEHQGSTFTMTAFIHYMLICAFLTIEGLTLGLIFGIFPGFMLVLGASGAMLFLLLHRPVRGLWVWCLWRMGLLE